MRDGIVQEAKQSNMKNVLGIHPRESVCPYISSTFEDFEEEFKHLQTNVFPKIDILCRKRGTRFKPVDFRRTVIDSRSSSNYTLQHALDSILQCSPFFMAVFGQHYAVHKDTDDVVLSLQSNFSPAPQHLSSHQHNLLNAGKKGHSWVLEQENQVSSMLEIEIKAAMLDKNTAANSCFFYVRDFKRTCLGQTSDYIGQNHRSDGCSATDNYASFGTESKYADNRLNSLKMRIVKKGWNIRYFSTPSELGAAVLDDWSRLICKLYPTVLFHTEFTNHVWCSQAMVEELTAKYCWCPDLTILFEFLNQHISAICQEDRHRGAEACVTPSQYSDGIFPSTSAMQFTRKMRNSRPEGGKNILVVVGDPGSGKSAFIAQWLRQFQACEPSVLVISQFIGSSHVSRDIGSFLRFCLKTIRELHGDKSMTFSELKKDTNSYSELVSAFEECIHHVPCVLVIDSLNNLKASMGEDIGSIKRLTWLPDKIPPNCRIIITTRQSDLTFKAVKERKDVIIKWVKPILKEFRMDTFNTHLASNVQQIGRKNAEKIVGNRLSEKPLYLSTLADLVSSCHTTHEIDQVIERCTDLRNFRDFWATTFNLWTRRFSWTKRSRGQPGFCRTRNTAVGWVAEALRLIASARNGLLETEILHLLSLLGYRGRTVVTPYDWMLFQKCASNSFSVHPEGYIRLSHTEIRHAAKFYLLGAILPTATGSASYLGQVNLQQHYHYLLASYFAKYGSLERKLIELPWQLEQGGDWITLCQVLSKPRFFQSFCRVSQTQPYLHVDLQRYWKKLNESGFYPTHYLQMGLEKCMDGRDVNVISRKTSSAISNQNWREPGTSFSGGQKLSKASALSPPRRPAMIIVTLHDGHKRESTVGSRSETGELAEAMSEEESCSFFMTQTETEFSVAGWTALENNPEQPIDESRMSEEESVELNYDMLTFLNGLGGSFTKDCKDGLFSLYQHLSEVKPLSTGLKTTQLKTITTIVRLSNDVDSKPFMHFLCEEAFGINDSISLPLVQIPFAQQLLEFRVLAYLHVVGMCMEKEDYKRAEDLLKLALAAAQQSSSTTQSCDVAFACAKLFVAQGLHSYAESLLKRVLVERLQWFGSRHMSVAEVLLELGDLYTITQADPSTSRGISLLAYKQALDIFKENSEKIDQACVLHKTACLLVEEGSLCSMQEAMLCYEDTVDAYTTEYGSRSQDIQNINSVLKKLSSYLRKSCFKNDGTVPSDTYSDERPYSTLSWNCASRDKHPRSTTVRPYQSHKRSMIPWTGNEKCKSTRSVSEFPYAAYSTSIHANRIIVTPTKKSARSISSGTSKMMKTAMTSLLPTNIGPKISADETGAKILQATPNTIQISKAADSSIETSDISCGWYNVVRNVGKADGHVMEFNQQGADGNINVPVAPVGRRTRLSVKLDVDDKSVISLPTKLSFQPHLKSRRSISARATNEIRDTVHRRQCPMTYGPDNIALDVHGVHSSLRAILSPPAAPRSKVQSSGPNHKIAWYNVPGRYAIPGKVLPPKHKQVRPEGPGAEYPDKS